MTERTDDARVMRALDRNGACSIDELYAGSRGMSKDAINASIRRLMGRSEIDIVYRVNDQAGLDVPSCEVELTASERGESLMHGTAPGGVGTHD